MANKADLMERNGRWYFSKAYPKDLWPITGASPFRKFSGTDSLPIALRARPDAERLYWSKVDAARATLEGRTPRKMTEVEAMGLMAKWFTAEDAERTAALEATQSPLMDIDRALAEIDALDADARQAVAEADVHAVRPLALQLIAEAGLEADGKSKEFKAFMAALLRGRRELLARERRRILGDFAVQPSDPLIAKVLAEGVAVGQAEEDAELEAFLLANPNRLIPRHLAAAFKRLNQAPAKEPNARKLSNRPHMTCCEGCGETVPKRDLYEYRAGGRARYCKPCIRRRAVERECVGCGETKLTSEFFEGLRNVSPYCRACRDIREHEKHCPRCDVTKPVHGFNRSRGRPAGWCKQCSVNAQRERRAALRSQTA